MEIVDVNVMLCAVNPSAADHGLAKRWLDRALGGGEPVGLTWVVLLAVIRLTTRRGLFPRPLSAEEAHGLVRHWVEAPSAVIIHPGQRHLDLLSGLLAEVGSAGNVTNDAHPAALAIEHGGEVVSFDADFARFPKLRWSRPS